MEKFDTRASVIVVDVFIQHNGIQKLMRMVLDTGATHVMISWKLAEILGLHPEIAKQKSEIITASGIEQVPLVVLGTVSAAGAEANNIQAVIHDLPSESGIDGLLGLSFLRNFNLELNFREGFLAVS